MIRTLMNKKLMQCTNERAHLPAHCMAPTVREKRLSGHAYDCEQAEHDTGWAKKRLACGVSACIQCMCHV